MDTPVDRKRAVCVIAHTGAGKTTLAEMMLFGARSIDKPGRVDDGTTHLDSEPEEQKRKITTASAVHHYGWSGNEVSIIDTPGYSDFLGEARSSLRVCGGAIVLLSAISGVKVQTEKIWSFADEFEVSRIAFVNKMDKDRASFLRAVDDMEKVLKVRGVPMQIPIGEGEKFSGIVDLLPMNAYLYKGDGTGAFEIADIPAEVLGQAVKERERAIEAIIEADDSLTERYLSGETISIGELEKALREAVLTRRFVPVYCGSALKNIGVNLLMDAVGRLLPSPLDKGVIRGVATGIDPRTGTSVKREPEAGGPFSAFVFKTIIDPFTGKVSVFRVYSGTIHRDSTVLNSSKGEREKISHLYLVEGRKLREVSSASAGDIVAAGKLKDTLAGDTLCDPAAPVVFATPEHTAPPLSYAIHPKTKADEDKAPSAISRLMEEDPSLDFRRDEHTNEFLLSGVGQVHLEVSVEKLKRKYGCDVDLKAPRVPYMETIRTHVKVQGKYKKQSGGKGHYGDAWLTIEPLDRGTGFVFVDAVTGGSVPRQFIPAVEKGVREAMHSGVLAGFPVVDVKTTLFDGSYHSVDSSEMAFKIAASMGFKKGMELAHPVLLEPVMKMEIGVPDDCLGDVISDINTRRGKILGAEPMAGSQTIRALVPMAEVVTYATDLKGLTRDRGLFTMEFSHYDEVPTYLAGRIIEGARASKADEKKDHA